MKFSIFRVLAFFLAVLAAAVLLFPRPMDLVVMYRKSGRDDKAASVMKNMEKKHEDNPEVMLSLGEIYNDMGRPEEALSVLSRVRPRKSVNARLRRALGQAAWAVALEKERCGRTLEAITIIKKYLVRDGRADALTWRTLGNLYDAEMMLDQKAGAFRKLLELEPDDLPALEFLSNYYSMRQQPEKAIPVLEAIERINPDDIPRRLLLVQLYMARRKPEDAARALRDLILDDPGNVNRAIVLGQLYDYLERPQEYAAFAMEHFDTETLNNENVKAILTRAGHTVPVALAPVDTGQTAGGQSLVSDPGAAVMDHERTGGAEIVVAVAPPPAARHETTAGSAVTKPGKKASPGNPRPRNVRQSTAGNMGRESRNGVCPAYYVDLEGMSVTRSAPTYYVDLKETNVSRINGAGSGAGVNAVRARASALHAQGKSEEALDVLRRARADMGDNPDLVVDSAEILTDMKRYDDAMLELEKID